MPIRKGKGEFLRSLTAATTVLSDESVAGHFVAIACSHARSVMALQITTRILLCPVIKPSLLHFTLTLTPNASTKEDSRS